MTSSERLLNVVFHRVLLVSHRPLLSALQFIYTMAPYSIINRLK